MNDPKTIEFFVPGIPRPGGSKRAFTNPKTGKIIVVDAGGQHTKDWRASVALAAHEAMGDTPPFGEPLFIEISFIFLHPKKHFRTGKYRYRLRDDAPIWHEIKPDLIKITRSTEDAMTGIVYRDDSQIASEYLHKRYGIASGALIKIETLSED